MFSKFASRLSHVAEAVIGLAIPAALVGAAGMVLCGSAGLGAPVAAFCLALARESASFTIKAAGKAMGRDMSTFDKPDTFEPSTPRMGRS